MASLIGFEHDSRTRRAGGVAAALLAIAGLVGCASEGPLIGGPDLPESPDVETAEWPRLIDVPPPEELTGENSVAAKRAKGQGIQTEIDGEAARLARQAAAMRNRSVFSDGDVDAEAAELRRLGREIHDQE